MSPALLARAEEAAADAVPRARRGLIAAAESFADHWEACASRPPSPIREAVDAAALAFLLAALRASVQRHRRAVRQLSLFTRAHLAAVARDYPGLIKTRINVGWA